MSDLFSYIPEPGRQIALQFVGHPALVGRDLRPAFVVHYRWGDGQGRLLPPPGDLLVDFGDAFSGYEDTKYVLPDEILLCDPVMFRRQHPALATEMMCKYAGLLEYTGRRI